MENEVRPAVVDFLAKRGLLLFSEKIKIMYRGGRFDFLEWNLRKLLIKPSKANIGALLAKLRGLEARNRVCLPTSSTLLPLERINWLFAGLLRSGKRTASILNLIQSARNNGDDSYAYLKVLLTRLPEQRANEIAELLPHRWRQS